MNSLNSQQRPVQSSHVFRSVPHLPQFQDFTEARPEIALENDPETAAILYYALFCEAGIIEPPPKSCVPISRSILLCSCGVGIFRRNPHFCDKCASEIYQHVPAEVAEDKKKSTKAKDPPAPKPRAWRPPPAPKVRQTWKKSKKSK